MNILITGRNGQLGKALSAHFKNATTTDHNTLDISSQSQVESFFKNKNFDTIINAAAYVNADHSETTEGRKIAWLSNAVGPRNLAKIAIDRNCLLIHISSEYVFDGTKKSHKENEPLTPLNVYGETKAAADIAVSLVPRHYILRTSWVIGDGHNFVKTMHNLAKDKRINPKVVNDQFGRLTFVSELVRAIDHLLNVAPPPGTYNLSNSGPIKSWADIAASVFKLSGYDPNRIEPITTDEYMKFKHPFAPRPKYSDLDLSKIQKTGFKSQNYQSLMRDYIKKIS